jgi:hypothetical protein
MISAFSEEQEVAPMRTRKGRRGKKHADDTFG